MKGIRRIIPLYIWVFTLYSCNDDEGDLFKNIEAVVSPHIKTVVTVYWNTEEPATCYVEYGPTDQFGLQTPLEEEPSTEHEAILLGLTANTTYFYRAAIHSGGGEEEFSEIQTVTTEALPPVIPSFIVEGEGDDEYMLVPINGSTVSPLIVNPSGQIVWYYESPGIQIYRSLLSSDGESILYNSYRIDSTSLGNTDIFRVSLDGSEKTLVATFTGRNHDFVEHPDGTLGTLEKDYLMMGENFVYYDRIVEVYQDGTERVVWEGTDLFDIPGGLNHDYYLTNGNALDYDPLDEYYYIGLKEQNCILKIDRAGGTCLWIFGGKFSTFSFPPDSPTFRNQHQFDIGEDTILVFDNDGSPEGVSRVLEYAYDEESMEAWVIRQYKSESNLYSEVIGDVVRLDDGDLLVTWSMPGQIERVAPDDEVTFQINAPLGNVFGYNTILDEIYSYR